MDHFLGGTPVSIKYSLGVLTSLLVKLLKYGSSNLIISAANLIPHCKISR